VHVSDSFSPLTLILAVSSFSCSVQYVPPYSNPMISLVLTVLMRFLGRLSSDHLKLCLICAIYSVIQYTCIISRYSLSVAPLVGILRSPQLYKMNLAMGSGMAYTIVSFNSNRRLACQIQISGTNMGEELGPGGWMLIHIGDIP
jgi:hypothetical protein